MGAILSFLIPAVPTLVKLVESVFVQRGAGGDKMKAVLKAVRALVDQLADSGAIQKDERPNDDQLRGVIESILSQMKAAPGGILGADGAAAGELYLVRGTVIPLRPAAAPGAPVV